MSGAKFIDTNVLLYSVSDDPAEAPKRRTARTLLESVDFCLSAQVLVEFYVNATRGGAASLSHAEAARVIDALGTNRTQPFTREIVVAALRIRDEFGISYWDAAILAAAQAMGCDTVYSEDLQHGRVYGGVQVVDPFRAG